MEAKADYTQDDTVDFRGQPVVSSKTGKWKACAFLVDIVSSVRNVNNWSESVWIMPILGAYTFTLSSLVYVLARVQQMSHSISFVKSNVSSLYASSKLTEEMSVGQTLEELPFTFASLSPSPHHLHHILYFFIITEILN
uniref:Uncharacterized protein n=1 Tax=Glycine max TaxID=3847 RepID=A0A0R0HR70_SOYBN